MIYKKTCSKCGETFDGKTSRSTICPNCKAPKPIETRVMKCCPKCKARTITRRCVVLKVTHKMGMKAVRETLPRYTCNKCGAKFDVPVLIEQLVYSRKAAAFFHKKEANPASQ